MLIAQHKFASRVTNSVLQQDYRTHMCGLCHELGDNYGQLARFLTTYDLILLDMFVNAQREDKPEEGIRRCPLNPFRKVSVNVGSANELSAAIAVIMAKIDLVDKIYDSTRGNIQVYLNYLLDFLLGPKYRLAAGKLHNLSVNTEILDALSEMQAKYEELNLDAVLPTAKASASLFEATAEIALNPSNKTALQMIGKSYGEYIYLADAFRDFPKDMLSGDFNLFRAYAQQSGQLVILSFDGIEWFDARLSHLQKTILTQLDRLILFRYQDTIRSLLIDPIEKMQKITTRQIEKKVPLSFYVWSKKEIIGAAAFVSAAIALPVMASQFPETLRAESIRVAHNINNHAGAFGLLGEHSDWLLDLLQDDNRGLCVQCGDSCGDGCDSCRYSDCTGCFVGDLCTSEGCFCTTGSNDIGVCGGCLKGTVETLCGTPG